MGASEVGDGAHSEQLQYSLGSAPNEHTSLKGHR
jgi:hypothetical protein